MIRTTLAQLVEQRRAELRKLDKRRLVPVDAYASSVKVDFVAVLDRHLRNCRSVA